MKKFGTFLLWVGGLFALFALFTDVSVSGGIGSSGRIVNQGLIADQHARGLFSISAILLGGILRMLDAVAALQASLQSAERASQVAAE